jgi:hypothetical protein
MKAYLMHRDRDFVVKASPPALWPLLSKDLELDILIDAMAGQDKRVRAVVERALFLSPGNDLQTIAHRQAALKDCLRNPEVVRGLYALAQDAVTRQGKVWGHFREYPSGLLDYSVEQMTIFMDVLKRVRNSADANADQFESEAFRSLFATLSRELDDTYFKTVDAHLSRLKFRGGLLVSARLGKGLKGADYVLRRPLKRTGGWLTQLLSDLFSQPFFDRSSSFTLYLAPRDEAGAQAMSELRDRGLGLAADALARSAKHILSFFEMLLEELAFYVGCLNLHARLGAIGGPFAFPIVDTAESQTLGYRDLYDVNLALRGAKRPVGNDFDADGKTVIIVTGANQGGKTTFLRSLGAAQIMAQAGMFVAAGQFRTSLAGGVFTHFKREEDASMKSGKFDEELKRMSEIVAALVPRSLLLFNESFSATNEREGSEIARQIVTALFERGFRIVFVSHQYAFTHEIYRRGIAAAAFLRADRQIDGSRNFKLVEGEPLSTSFGEDVYHEVFGAQDNRVGQKERSTVLD